MIEDKNIEAVKNIIGDEQLQKFSEDIAEYTKTLKSSGSNQRAYDEVSQIHTPEKIFSDAKEIVFEIRTIVFNENEKAEIIGTESVHQDRIHVPVPATADHKEYASEVFNMFMSCLAGTLKENNNEQNHQIE